LALPEFGIGNTCVVWKEMNYLDKPILLRLYLNLKDILNFRKNVNFDTSYN